MFLKLAWEAVKCVMRALSRHKMCLVLWNMNVDLEMTRIVKSKTDNK